MKIPVTAAVACGDCQNHAACGGTVGVHVGEGRRVGVCRVAAMPVLPCARTCDNRRHCRNAAQSEDGRQCEDLGCGRWRSGRLAKGQETARASNHAHTRPIRWQRALRMHWAASFPAQSNQVPRSRVEVRRSTRPLGSLLGAFLARSLPHGHRAAVELASTVQIAAMAGVCGTRMKGLLTCIRQSRNSCSNCTEVGCSVKTSKSRAKYSEAQRMTACTRLLPMYK